MYLSNREHDQFRTIVMGFEVPFRTFIARRLTSVYNSEEAFSVALNNAIIPPDSPVFVASEMGKIRANTAHYYKVLLDTVQACNLKCVPNEIDVPYVATLITLYLVFENTIRDYLAGFPNHSLYVDNLDKYKYARNKLDHPQSLTLQEDNMYPVLSLVKDAITAIYIIDDECFWEKSEEEIENEVIALETKVRKNPIEVNNFSIIPFSDNSIVCRQHQIDKVLSFVYGKPGTLKKKSSLSIFGYGGVGKTAIVTEAIRIIVRDILDNRTINGYLPKFILFYSAKKSKLDYSYTTGNIVEETVTTDFSTCEELELSIYKLLNIESFSNYTEKGLIIIDNFETIDQKERELIREFIETRSPQNIQYIITSRNEEPYEERMSVDGFIGDDGVEFIDTYIEENNLEIDITRDQKEELLSASKGNTLVLVLSLQRLDKRLVTVQGIAKDLNQSTVKSISKELSNVPLNGFEIVSEFMFKNTFDELESLFGDKRNVFISLLQVFAVYPTNSIDVFTICIVTDLNYNDILPMVNLLCKYLILEKKDERYSLNPFAEKYIVQKLLPDSTTSEKLSREINKSISEIRNDVIKLESDLKSNEKIRNIINDWAIEYDGDKIAAAKIYNEYEEINATCLNNGKYHIESSYKTFCSLMKKIEPTTMHPYIKFQKARILQLFYQTQMISSVNPKTISDAYNECVWAIKSNSLYYKIMGTKSYASLLWIFGLFWDSVGNRQESIKYLEDAKIYFETIDCRDLEYYKCISKLGTLYITEYESSNYYKYLKKAKSISNILYDNHDYYSSDNTTRKSAAEISRKIKKYK